MIMTDFVYDSQLLSGYGYMVAYMITSPSDSISMGSELTFDTFYNGRTFETENLRAKYETPITFTCDIFKNDCNNTDVTFNELELSHIMTWLNSSTSKTFIPIYDDSSYEGMNYRGTFTSIQQINVNNQCIGVTVTFTATSPWGYAMDREINKIIPNGGGSFTIINDSDQVGYLYPSDVIIRITQDGDLKISNSLEPNHTVIINGCKKNEIITMDAKRQIITSSNYRPKDGIKIHEYFYNDFNYNFFRMVKTTDENTNKYTVSIGCEISLTHSPIRKVGVIV